MGPLCCQHPNERHAGGRGLCWTPRGVLFSPLGVLCTFSSVGMMVTLAGNNNQAVSICHQLFTEVFGKLVLIGSHPPQGQVMLAELAHPAGSRAGSWHLSVGAVPGTPVSARPTVKPSGSLLHPVFKDRGETHYHTERRVSMTGGKP